MTPGEFKNYMDGERLREELVLDKVRVLAATMYNSSGYAKSVVKPTDIISLSIDKPVVKPKRPTLEQILKWQQGRQ